MGLVPDLKKPQQRSFLIYPNSDNTKKIKSVFLKTALLMFCLSIFFFFFFNADVPMLLLDAVDINGPCLKTHPR